MTELYWEDEPEDEPERPTVDARGRDCTKPRGVPSRLTERQVEAAYQLHVEAGLSIRELARRGWKVWGYSNANVAATALGTQFKRLGLSARDRVEATRQASTIHGRAPRYHQGDPEFLEYRREKRRESGEVRGVYCAGTRTQYPRKGHPCRAYAQAGKDYCIAHDPERAEEREARLVAAREKLS